MKSIKIISVGLLASFVFLLADTWIYIIPVTPFSTQLPPDNLHAFDRWRYLNCLSSASNRPTDQGVRLAQGACDDRFTLTKQEEVVTVQNWWKKDALSPNAPIAEERPKEQMSLAREAVSTPEPDEGVLDVNTANALVAPLSITTPTGDHSYFAKLVEVSTSRVAMTMFIRPGSRIEIKAPLGEYRLRYASGVRWQGEAKLFGSETLYNEAEKTFEFRKTGTQFEGFSVRLIMQRDGNLETRSLRSDQF